MKKQLKFIALLAFTTFINGCSTIVTEKANLELAPNGIRIYPPKVYLLVDTTEKKSTLSYLPDFSRAYDVKPLTILSTQEFKVELDEGQLKTFTSKHDTTAILTFLGNVAELGAKAAGIGVSSKVINGTFGLSDGIYLLGDNGTFSKIN